MLKEKKQKQNRSTPWGSRYNFPSSLRVHSYHRSPLADLREETFSLFHAVQILALKTPSQCPLGLPLSINDRNSHSTLAPLPERLCSLPMDTLLQRILQMVPVTSSLQLSLLLRDERLLQLSVASSQMTLSGNSVE